MYNMIFYIMIVEWLKLANYLDIFVMWAHNVCSVYVFQDTTYHY
jgi:hypothetical protein